MRSTWIWAAIGVVAVGVVVLGMATGALKLGGTTNICAIDDEIADADRASAETVAAGFANNALFGDSKAAYAMMTQEAQATVTAAELAQRMRALVRQGVPFSPLKHKHTYLVTTTGANGEVMVACGGGGEGEQVFLEAKSPSSQAHVVMTSQTRNNSWETNLWLLPDGHGGWRVQYFHIQTSAMGGHGPEDMVRLARGERAAGHPFNATMLYVGAQGLIDRGPVMHLEVEQTLRDDLKDFKPAPEFNGTPPFSWTLNGRIYRVKLVTIMGADKNLGLTFDLPLAAWKGNDAADASNRAFLGDFTAAHKEVMKVFSFAVARALKPDNIGGFATVYDAQKGFLPSAK